MHTNVFTCIWDNSPYDSYKYNYWMIVSSNVWYTFFHILGMFQFLAWTNWSKITKCLSNKPLCWNNKALWCGEIYNKIHINITDVHGLLLSQNHFQDEANIKWCSNDILQVQQNINCFVCENAERLKYHNIIKPLPPARLFTHSEGFDSIEQNTFYIPSNIVRSRCCICVYKIFVRSII